MKIAFAYAGQGSQYVGMGKDIYEKYEAFRNVFDLSFMEFPKNLCFYGPEEELNKTKNTQPAMVAFAVGVTEVLKENNIFPEYSLGLSLGEYSALYSSGVFDIKTVMDIISFRGEVMQNVAEGTNTVMSAIIGLDKETVSLACEEGRKNGRVQIANYNCPTQIVIGGEDGAVSLAEEKAKELGAKKCIRLNVSGAFHTDFMLPAAEKLKEKFKDISFSNMKVPVVFNAMGRVKNEDESISKLLERQVSSSVYFEQSIQFLIENGVDTIIEIGPGKALSGFIKKIDKSIKLFKIDSADDLLEVIKFFKGE